MSEFTRWQSASSRDLSFLARLKRREPAAFVELFNRFGPAVFRLARLKLGDSVSAEDAAQEVFVRAFTKIDSLESDRLLPWLLKVTRNHCCDLLRKRGRSLETPTDFTEPRFDRPASANKSDLPEMLLGLTDIEREVVLLRIHENAEYRDIAETLEMNEGSVRNVFSRAIGRLREGYSTRES